MHVQLNIFTRVLLRLQSFDVLMATNVIRAITQVAGTPAAVAKVHLGVRFVGDSANFTLVKILRRPNCKSLRLAYHMPMTMLHSPQDFRTEENQEIRNCRSDC